MMKVLVTGAVGFMGSWISKRLFELGYDVYGIDNLSGGTLDNWRLDFSRLFLEDLTSKKAKEIILDLKPQVIFYLASSAREGASQFDPVRITKDNYWAYVNTIETAIKTRKLKKVILFSSMAVYGNQKPPFDESLPRKPEDIYGINKSAMEHTTEILSKVHGFGYTIIRPHNVFGEYQAMDDPYRNVIAIFMNRILRGEPIYIYGDGNQKRAFSYIRDSLDCYIKCIDEKYNGQIYNIGGIEPITINELAEIIIEEFKEFPRPKIIHLPARPCEVKYAWTTWEKSVKDLGYKEIYGFRKGIKLMAKWAKEKGKQEWRYENLALEFSDKLPKTWKYKL